MSMSSTVFPAAVSGAEQGPVRRGGAGDAPAQFLWQGRLHVVRAVLAHTTRDRVEEWRVRAAAGRDAAPRVFVLRFDWSDGRWTVLPEPADSPEPGSRAEAPSAGRLGVPA
jgi:hypothetical protein